MAKVRSRYSSLKKKTYYIIIRKCFGIFHEQKILMSVNMRCQKCRSEALKIGAKTTGKLSLYILRLNKILIGNTATSTNVQFCFFFFWLRKDFKNKKNINECKK